MVDGPNMDKLFTVEQAAPTTTSPTTRNDENLVSITTLMLPISSKNAAHSADNDKGGLIDHKNILMDVQE